MPKQMNSRILFLTGATGLLGNELLRGYLEAPEDIQILVLIRGAAGERENKFSALVADADALTRQRFAARAQPVWGDVTQPRLGLSEQDGRALADGVTDIVHSAASIDFALPLNAARAVNYQGTVNLVEFARACRNLYAFAHVSTAHVAGRRTGLIAEDELEHNAGFVNSYEQSKYEAEQFLRARMAELPIAVYRSTTLIGDSRGGIVRQFNFFHIAMRFAYHGLIPALPGVPDGHIDFIPTDYAARAIQYLVDHNFRPGTTYHICAEPAKSYTLQELVDSTLQIFRTSPWSKKKKIRKLPIVDSATFDQILREAREDGRGRVRQAIVPLTYFMPHLALPKVFDTAHARRDLQGSGLQVPDIRSYYPQVVEYCLRTDWGRRAAG
jgi:thioester reductase-like protein